MAFSKYKSGDVINHFELIKPVGSNRGRELIWKVKCLKCNNNIEYSVSACKKNKNCKYCINNTGDKNPTWAGIGDISGSFYSNIKSQAKFRGIEFTLTKQDFWDLFIKQNKRCALSGLELYFEKCYTLSIHNKGTASLDRVDSSKGYILGNVQWVHKDINYMKQCYSNDVFIDFCKKVAAFHN